MTSPRRPTSPNAVPDAVDLPIDAVLGEVLAALEREPSAVIEAPPGAGKTTRVPLALLDQPWLDDARILLLEPRRVAARAAAARMADSLGEKVGQTVGFRVRHDTRVSAATRIEVVTEGVLTRMLQSDPTLAGTGVVIFDEFHERSLHADLGLALALETQLVLRPDLRLLVMSATLDTRPIASLLGEVPVISSDGRLFPVETVHRPRVGGGRIEEATADAVAEALADHDGDILVFLPGAGWIRRTGQLLGKRVHREVVIRPLYGLLSTDEQDLALQPDPQGRRKVVLATDIAQTSLTIDGIRVVIDAGLTRSPRFDPGSGLTRLETRSVSIASADQRRGRAGRQAPGVCYRLWSASDHERLEAHDQPEILGADLTGLRLELARWGSSDADELPWLDRPPAAALNEATDLLHQLGALDAAGRITPHGRAMADLGADPRLGHLILAGDELGHGGLACDIAGLLSSRDPLIANRQPDLRLRIDLLENSRGRDVRWGALEQARRSARTWRERLRAGKDPGDPDAAGLLLSLAYPDRIAIKRGRRGTFLLANGRGAELADTDPLAREDFIVVADLDGDPRKALIRLAAPLDADDLLAGHGDRIETHTVVEWDRRAREVAAETQHRLDAIVIKREPLTDPPAELLTAALIDGVRREGLSLLTWKPEVNRWRARVGFLREFHGEDWPALDDESLLTTLDDWLLPHLGGIRRRRDLERLDLASVLSSRLGWRQGRDLDRFAPTHLTVPSGSRIPIDYEAEDGPVLAVRLQELFGLTETPTLADGRVPVVLHLLSPAHRPMQVTRDLASFWANTYPEVKAELAGRYPKHPWPDDPLQAEPTNRTKRRK